jgi:hypothetical protein
MRRSVLLGLQVSNGLNFDIASQTKEALDFQFTMRMVRDKFHAAPQVMEQGLHGVIPPLANCILARAAVMVTRLGWRTYLTEDEFEELRYNLKRFRARWTIAGMLYSKVSSAICLYTV